jgi:hypothetical protein
MLPDDKFPQQLSDLENASDARVRNALALQLAERNAQGLQDVLIRLIKRPDLANSRGTLVHALDLLDCSDHLGLLVDLVVTGNWEVAHEALQILETLDEVDGDDVDLARAALGCAKDVTGPDDWRSDLLEDLSEMFG